MPDSMFAKVFRLKMLLSKLEGYKVEAKRYHGLDVEVGYSARYAIYVHEDLTMNHPNGGQAKFLEQVLRTKVAEINDVIAKVIKQRGGVEKALTKAGEFVLKESKLLVPVDTGYLRDSGFVRIKRDKGDRFKTTPRGPMTFRPT